MKIQCAVLLAIIFVLIQIGNNAMAQRQTTATRVRVRTIQPMPTPVVSAKPQISQEKLDWDKRQERFLKDFPGMMDEWRKAADPKLKKGLADNLEEKIIYFSEHEDAFDELVAGGPLEEKAVKVPATSKDVPIRPIKIFSEITLEKSNGWPRANPWVDRRITSDALEVWTSREGWLFNGKGELLNHAAVPRRDGHGLKWYGAFIPDGRWVTTDLWDFDCALYLYSRDGKYIKNLPAAGPDWARSDKDGKGWVCGPDPFWIDPDTKAEKLTGTAPWQRCYPRQLGARYEQCPSDDGKLMLTGDESGHGRGVGFPTFVVRRVDPKNPIPQFWEEDLKLRIFALKIPGHSISLGGFWPGRHEVYINGRKDRAGNYRIWFLDEAGECRGLLDAVCLADAAGGGDMLFRLRDGRIAELGNDLKTREVRRYVNATGKPVEPKALYDDLKLGLFIDDGKLELAGW